MSTTAAHTPAASADYFPPTSVQHQSALAKTARARAARDAAAQLVAAAAALTALREACAACGESTASLGRAAEDLRTTAQQVTRRYA